MKHVNAAPEPPSARVGKPISRDLEGLLLRCLAKSPSDRPRDAAELLSNLNACAIEGTWTADDAAAWWAARGESVANAETAALATVDHAPVQQQEPAPDITVAYEGDTKKS